MIYKLLYMGFHNKDLKKIGYTMLIVVGGIALLFLVMYGIFAALGYNYIDYIIERRKIKQEHRQKYATLYLILAVIFIIALIYAMYKGYYFFGIYTF